MSSEVIGRLITDFNNLNEKCIHLQKSEELQQLRQLEIISQNLHNNLGILGSDKNDNTDGEQKNDIKITEEKNKFSTIKNDEQKNHNNLEILGSDKTKKNDNTDGENKKDINFFEILANQFNEQKNRNMDKPPSEYLLNFFNIKKDTEKSGLYSNIQVVVGLDFGSISTAFFIYPTEEPKSLIFTNRYLRMRDTKLGYNCDYSKLTDCGSTNIFLNLEIVESFKLYLGGLPDNLKSKLPIEFKRAIADYLKNIGKDIKRDITNYMAEADYFENVLLVFTVPAEYSEKDKDIMRECIYNAKLIKSKSSE
ncbi:hypothetical protein RhiirA4_475495, partial [Rhizophagus irregularis]